MRMILLFYVGVILPPSMNNKYYPQQHRNAILPGSLLLVREVL